MILHFKVRMTSAFIGALLLLLMLILMLKMSVVVVMMLNIFPWRI